MVGMKSVCFSVVTNHPANHLIFLNRRPYGNCVDYSPVAGMRLRKLTTSEMIQTSKMTNGSGLNHDIVEEYAKALYNGVGCRGASRCAKLQLSCTFSWSGVHCHIQSYGYVYLATLMLMFIFITRL